MNVFPLALYAVACAAYLWHFATRHPMVGRAATTLLVAAALSHTFVIGMVTMQAGQIPIAGTAAALSTFVLLLALAYLYTEVTTDERAMGAFILPLLVAFQAIPVLQPDVNSPNPALQGPLFGLHVSSVLFAYASFALAFVIGLTYVLLFKEIKAKHLGFFYARLPSLQVLDTMNQRAIAVGWVFLTIGLIAGAAWITYVRVDGASDPQVQAMSLSDPKIFLALVCWVVYAFEVFGARRIGWGGRRAAYLSAIGFAIVTLNFVPISYLVSNSHDF